MEKDMEGLSLRGRGSRGRLGRGGRGGGVIQGGWSDLRGRGSPRSRGNGGWNRFHDEENNGDPQSNGRAGRGGLQYNPSVDTKAFDAKMRDHQNQQIKAQQEPLKKKNTENFDPSHEPSQMRILYSGEGTETYDRPIQTRDVLLVSNLFCKTSDLTLYNKLHSELENSGLTEHQIWSSWHGDSHLIANDRVEWKKHCPTFHFVLSRIRDYFSMDIRATRLNWYRNSSEWKPFHHDAAAVKEEKAKQSNLTVAVSFGLEREAAFEHADTKTVISMPQPNGSVYVFARDINVLWRHGILQMPPDKRKEEGRISLIAWGWVDQIEA